MLLVHERLVNISILASLVIATSPSRSVTP
jgi:hypothetical protein